MSSKVSIKATPNLLGANGETQKWVTVSFTKSSGASAGDWVALFSPAKFDGSQCLQDLNLTNEGDALETLYLQRTYQVPIRQLLYYGLRKTGKGSLKFLVINQRYDYAFGFFSGDVTNKPDQLWCISGKKTSSGSWELLLLLLTQNLTFCGPPASTLGWRDPGYTHTAFLKNLWPLSTYNYKVGHKLKNGQYVWGDINTFKSSPYPGQDSLQRIIIFGDMGKHERDGSTEYSDDQSGALIVTDALLKDIANYDMVSNITKSVPWMLSAGNHERDWPNSGSFYITTDSGGECGAVMLTMYPAPTKNKDKYWYSADYGKFHFCVANSKFDWRKDVEQYKFLEECLASVDRQAQPWLIFPAHQAIAYSSGAEYQAIGTFGEPMGRDNMEELWQKYKVDTASYGHPLSKLALCMRISVSEMRLQTTQASSMPQSTLWLELQAGTQNHLAL
ncbi:unnamed protein product [Calypogeia fissa]